MICFNSTVYERDITWNNHYHMLFIDNPVGTGFSYTNDGGYSSNEDDVADNLYRFDKFTIIVETMLVLVVY